MTFRSQADYRAAEEAMWARLQPLLAAGGVLRPLGDADGGWSVGDEPAISSGAVLRLFAAGRLTPVLSGWVIAPASVPAATAVAGGTR